MNKQIAMSYHTWNKILSELKLEHPKSLFLIRDRMKSGLGFTVREHEIAILGRAGEFNGYDIRICLDFYSANKRTMFLMKFSQLLNGDKL